MTFTPRKATHQSLTLDPTLEDLLWALWAEMRRGGGVRMLDIPTPKGLWLVPMMFIRLWPSLSLRTHLGYRPIPYTSWSNLGSWKNEAWTNPENLLFGPSVLGRLLHQQSYMGSLTAKAWVNSRIFLDHLWFPALSSASSVRGRKNLSEDPRIPGTKALQWDLTCCLV